MSRENRAHSNSHVNHPQLAGIRLAYYVLFAFLVVIGATMYVWRRWLN